MRKKAYQAPRIIVCEMPSQPILAGSDLNANADIKANDTVTYGDDDKVWEDNN